MKYTCMIVDDEPLARKVLSEYVAEIPDLEVAEEAKSALEAQQLLERERPDILFLDINMPKLSGIEWLRQMDDPPLVILTTAYSEYAVDAFELQAFDYLVKPISFERFLMAVNRARKQLNQSVGDHPAVHWISIRESKRLYKVDVADISHLQAYGDYVRIFTEEKVYMPKARLASILAELPDQFLQVHRSYIVNLDRLQYMEGNFVKVADKKIPVSASYKDDLTSRL